ncbi:MAG: peptidylprolyl isomerase [Bacteroidetes bacterium]|nr:peptidylprolyl isomerase [Bacteroidota bacterium]
MIEKYLSLLFDVNANVSRQAAISISNIKIEKGLKENLYENILELINNSNITDNARGELFVNYCNYKNDKYLELIENYDSIISPDFIYRILSNYLLLPQNNFDYIKGNIKDTTETDFLNIAQAVIPLQESLSGNAEFNKFILSILNSSSPIGILLIAENLDSVIVENNISALQQIILEQVFTYINNKNYSESLKSLYRLSKNISGDFALELLQIFKTSQVNLLSAFAKNILNEKIYAGADKDIDFNIIWEYSFKYSRAKINTDKGSFVIEFTPSFAPVSVGNFCYLASEKYFNGCLFHRVVPNFVIQTGDPSGTGWSGPGYEITSEYSLQPFDEAYVGMASSGKDTEGSQWFVMHSNFPHLDWRYTNFGKVISGMDIVNKIDQKDRIINIELLK